MSDQALSWKKKKEGAKLVGERERERETGQGNSGSASHLAAVKALDGVAVGEIDAGQARREIVHLVA